MTSNNIDSIPKGWQQTTLGEAAEVVGGFAFRGEDFSSQDGFPVIKITDVKPPYVDVDNAKFVHAERYDEKKIQRFLLSRGDYVVAMTGATIGKVGRVISNKKAYLNQRVAKINPKKGLSDENFIYYLLFSDNFTKFIQRFSSGSSAQQNISATDIGMFDILLPPLSEQIIISGVFSCLDKKIELLQKQNETLEEIAQTIFNEKIVSREEVDLPEDWTTGGLPSIANFLNGIALQKHPATDTKDSLPAIKIKELKSGITGATDRISRDLPEKYIIHDGDVLFSWSGSLEVVIWQYGDGALNQHLFKVSSEKYPKWFYYFWLLRHLPDFRSIAANKATTMGHIQRYHLDEAKVLIPDDSTLKELDTIIAPIFNKIVANNSQVKELVSLRNLLLPQLMSGKLKV